MAAPAIVQQSTAYGSHCKTPMGFHAEVRVWHAFAGVCEPDQESAPDQPMPGLLRQRRQPVAQIASIEHMLEAAEVGLSAEVVEQVLPAP